MFKVFILEGFFMVYYFSTIVDIYLISKKGEKVL